ncbi:hypothetical protein HHL11_12535 [Ramlibacter sp. G-1-2-2]|uniref:DUF2059 domain-containing protein n=1 Tax=Ramlibacter agri TaxID=2728837 RepID=A0A848H1A5_9BURK|nr:hypothetical protein [Ramlibacter agri]NML44585.1 hypothetical protein [Ramlibacter agri]
MKFLLRAFCLAALLAAATLARADIDRPAAESLVRKSGIWEQVGNLAPQVEAEVLQGFAQAGVEPADSEKARIARAVETAYAPERLRDKCTAVVAEELEARHLEALQRWFDSPDGQAITRAEEASSQGEDDPRAAMQEGMALLRQMPAARRKLLQNLMAATRAAEAMVQLSIGTAIAVQIGAASAQPGAPAPSADQLKDMLETQRPEMVEASAAITLALFARTYATVPAERLRRYLSFVRTPAGTRFNDVSFDAVDAALTDAAREMGRRLPGTRDSNNI